MRDLIEMEASVRDPDSRPHFKEAVRAYQAGAYRSAIVETWVAIALDLTDKIRHLAESGDGAAAVEVAELDQAIRDREVAKMQEHERTLVERCRDAYELITQREAAELSRVYEDRNLCAHPAFVYPGEVFSPSAELTRSHLAIAVDCALALPPVSGKQIIDQLKSELDSHSWPQVELTDFIRTQYFAGQRLTTRLNLVKLCVKCALQPPPAAALQNISVSKAAMRYRLVLDAISTLDPELLERATGEVLRSWNHAGRLTDETLIRLVGALGHLPMLWRVVEDPTKARVVAVLRGAPATTLRDERVFSAGYPADPEVRTAYQEALEKLISDTTSLDRLIKVQSLDKSQWVGPALRSLEEASSFREGEARLRAVLDLSQCLQENDLRRLATIIRNNSQIHRASDTPDLLLNLSRETARITNAQAIWRELATGLHEDYMADHDDEDGYYSYSELMREVEAPAENLH